MPSEAPRAHNDHARLLAYGGADHLPLQAGEVATYGRRPLTVRRLLGEVVSLFVTVFCFGFIYWSAVTIAALAGA